MILYIYTNQREYIQKSSNIPFEEYGDVTFGRKKNIYWYVFMIRIVNLLIL